MRLKYDKGYYHLKLDGRSPEELMLEGWELAWDDVYRTPSTILAREYDLYSSPDTIQRMWEYSRRMELSRTQDSNMVIPAPEGREYMPYQKAGIAYASELDVCLIADEMGLGKTIQAIGLVNLLDEVHKVCVVCPAFLRYNWRKEFAGWLTKPIHLEVFSYNKVEDASSMEWDIVIYDEAHYLKNPKAIRTTAGLALKSKRKLFLTGTPILSRPIEIYTMLKAGGYEIKQADFEKRYCGAKRMRVGRNKMVWWNKGATRTNELQAELRGMFMV